jgi:hypothetical protein
VHTPRHGYFDVWLRSAESRGYKKVGDIPTSPRLSETALVTVHTLREVPFSGRCVEVPVKPPFVLTLLVFPPDFLFASLNG